MTRYLIGVAWPYANGPQHIGHLAGNGLPADIFARYHRLAGDEVVMVSGSDMHGTPTTFRAEEEGVDPSVIAERYHAVHAESFRRLGISFDLYTHTHTALHARTAQSIFLTLLQEGFIDKRSAPEAYCPKHRRALPDRFLRGTCPHCGNEDARGDECDRCGRALEAEELRSPACRLCGTPAVFRDTEQFYLRLDLLPARLEEHFREVRDHWRPEVRSFTENYVKQGLRPRAITRTLPWGVPIPLDGYDDRRLYVWFEAVIGYLSATQEWANRQGTPDAWHRFWDAKEDARVYQFMGKDNITFHTVIWPAILLGVGGLHLPYDVPANAWLVQRGGKMAKSGSGAKGSTLLPDLLQHYDPDAVRFYGAYHMPQNHDTEFSFEEFLQDHDQVLADQWGNLVHRVLTFLEARYGGSVPSPPPGWSAEASPVGRRIREVVSKVRELLEGVREKEALDAALELVREANRYVHDGKPWAREGPERDRVVYESLWYVRALTVLLAPYLPFSCERAARMQGAPELLSHGNWSKAAEPPTPGSRVSDVRALFTKLLVPPTDGKTVEAPTAPTPRSGAAPAISAAARPPPGLQILVGTVRSVESHPNADKLYVLQVDIGAEKPRTLVAGLKAFYRPEELQGTSLAMLANLEPRPLRGVTSQGMVLAAESGPTVSVLRPPPGTPPGTPIGETAGPPASLPYDEFARARLVVGQVVAHEGGIALDAGAGPKATPFGPNPPPSVIVRLDRHGEEHPEPLRTSLGGYLTPDRPLPPGAKVR